MNMNSNNTRFIFRSRQALNDAELQKALNNASTGFSQKRKRAIDAVSNFDALKSQAQTIKKHTLENLSFYLKQFEENVIQSGGTVHWADTPEALNQIVLDICKTEGAKTIAKGKSMISEETELNQFLEDHHYAVTETDLGEYIIQLASEKPSHIIAPAAHKTKDQVRKLFEKKHDFGQRNLEEVSNLVNEARDVLRQKFLNADVGITGANFLIADTGSVVLVTNEGNGDLTATLPNTHIVTASIEKVIPNLSAAAPFINILARSATGQPISTYTSLFTGPKRQSDLDGPSNFHVILLDNGRSDMLTGPYAEMLSCIRCGACLNHCPVYLSVGGHSYGWIYPGPMGSVLSPLLKSETEFSELPIASTFCGRCEEVCPMGIPLPQLLRQLRNDQANTINRRSLSTYALKAFHWSCLHPSVYKYITSLSVKVFYLIGTLKNRFRVWNSKRYFPTPETSQTFHEIYESRKPRSNNGKSRN